MRSLAKGEDLQRLVCELDRMSLGVYFNGLSKEAIKMLYTKYMQYVQLPAGTNFISPGQNADTVYMVVEGSVMVTVNPGEREPGSTWAQVRVALVDVTNQLDRCEATAKKVSVTALQSEVYRVTGRAV